MVNMTTFLETAYNGPNNKRLFDGILKQNKLENLQLFFKSSVLDKYRKDSGYKIIRTDSSGRISKQGSWSLDFGISGDDELIHFPVERWNNRLPEAEQAHWLESLVTLPVSDNFIKGIVRPGCLDDGSIRNW